MNGAGAESRAIRPVPGSTLDVLIVDDDADSREMLADLLASEGFAADVACNGLEALEKAHARHPRLIVLDMMMPVMDGWAFCAERRLDPVLAAIPVVVVSATPRRMLEDLGVAAVFQKPFDYDGLLSAVRANCQG